MFTDCSMKRNICWWMAAENWTWTTVGQHLEGTQCWVSLWKMRIFGICARNVSLGNCSVLCLVLLPFFHWLICVWMSKPWNLLVLSSSFSAAEDDWSSYNLCSLLSSKHNWKDFWCVWEAALEWGWAEGLKWNSGSWNVWDWPSSQSCAAKEHCARAWQRTAANLLLGHVPLPNIRLCRHKVPLLLLQSASFTSASLYLVFPSSWKLRVSQHHPWDRFFVWIFIFLWLQLCRRKESWLDIYIFIKIWIFHPLVQWEVWEQRCPAWPSHPSLWSKLS